MENLPRLQEVHKTRGSYFCLWEAPVRKIAS